MSDDWHDTPWATTYDSNKNAHLPWELQEPNWLVLKFEWLSRKIIRFWMRRLPSQQSYIKEWRKK